MDYPDLDSYSVDVIGIFPIETSYNVGYRLGQELRTNVVIWPVSRANRNFSEEGENIRVSEDQTWQVCVTGMRKTPLGVDITPYIIERSKRCSDIFSLP